MHAHTRAHAHAHTHSCTPCTRLLGHCVLCSPFSVRTVLCALCTPSHHVPCLLVSVLETMPQVAAVPTNDFGVLVMPAERKEVSDAGSEELGSDEERTALLHSQDRQKHTAESFKSMFLLPDHRLEVRTSRTAKLPPRGSYFFSVASVTDGATFGYL